MLHTQKFLIENSLDKLSNEFSIKCTKHESLPLVILNYHQLDSSKSHPVVMECRGLVLNSETWDVVARAFPRFFNWGEFQDDMKNFNFSNFFTQEKIDGSLVLIYNFNGKWMANTRGSFANGEIERDSITWNQGFLEALKVNSLDELNLHPYLTYVCEFCSSYNKVVRDYKNPTMYLLSVFHKNNELTPDEVDEICLHPFIRPERHYFTSIDEIESYLNKCENEDPTYEGVVICDGKQRWKIKTSTWKALHQIRENPENPKWQIPFILSKNTDFLISVIPEVEKSVINYKNQIDKLYVTLMELWESAKDIVDQKEFAVKVKNHKLSGILFYSRKNNQNPEDSFRNSQELLLKVLER